jgi:ATP-binding cassette subfamily F protein uup
MDKLSDHLFVFKGNGLIEDHYCSYSEYREKQQSEEKKSKLIQKEAPIKNEKSKTKKNVTFKEKYEYEELEKEIAFLEKEKAELEKKLTLNSLSFDEISQSSERLGKVVEAIDEKSYRWMELDELM